MRELADDRSVRFARWWVRRYTSGLGPDQTRSRRAEIESDLAEHQRSRAGDGWAPKQIARERTTRLLRGFGDDIGWRHDVLADAAPRRRMFQASVQTVTSVAALSVALFHFAFSAYLLGVTSLADQRFLGGLDSYATEIGRPIASPLAAMIIAGLGVLLVAAAVARPISPLLSNAVTMQIAAVSVLFFWLGIWPIALVAVMGSAVDLAVRAPGGTLTS